MDVRIVMPPGMMGGFDGEPALDTALRVIAHAFSEPGEWATKYGTRFENDVFQMRPFCWCDSEDCKWCSGEAPNFWFKPTDFRMRWYKYIGRDHEIDSGSLPTDFLTQVLASHPDKLSPEQAFDRYVKHEEAQAADLEEFWKNPPPELFEP